MRFGNVGSGRHVNGLVFLAALMLVLVVSLPSPMRRLLLGRYVSDLDLATNMTTMIVTSNDAEENEGETLDCCFDKNMMCVRTKEFHLQSVIDVGLPHWYVQHLLFRIDQC